MKKDVNEAKKIFFSFLLIILLFFSVDLVLAQVSGSDAGQATRGVGEWILDFLQSLLFGTANPDSPLAVLTHIFMALILFSLIYTVVESMKFFEKKVFEWIVSISVTLLALIAVPNDFFGLVLPGYGALGAALLTILPFLIIFWFSIRVKSIYFAQMTWLIFALYYLGFYVMSALNIWSPQDGGASNVSLGWMYLAAGVLGFVMILGIPLIRGFFKGSAVDEAAKDIEHGGDLQAAVLKARAKEAKALTETVDETT